MTNENEIIIKLADQASKLGKIIMQYRDVMASLYELIHRPVKFDSDISKINRIEVMQIDKEEYERWQKVKAIIDKNWQ